MSSDCGRASKPSNCNLKGTFYVDDIRLVAAKRPLVTAVVESQDATRPETFTLSQNYPNPFNLETTIRFDLPQSRQIELAIYNLAAQRVATLVQGYREAGSYSVRWDGRTDGGFEFGLGCVSTDSRQGSGWRHGSCC